MAFRRPAGRPRLQLSRARRRVPTAWNGSLLNQTMSANVVYAGYLWDPSADPQYFNMQGRGCHLRTILYLNWQTPGTLSIVSYGVIALPTTAASAVPSAIIPDPSDVATWDKPWLDWGQWYLQATASQGFQSSMVRDIKQRRLLDDTEALMVIVVASTANTVVRAAARLLMRLE